MWPVKFHTVEVGSLLKLEKKSVLFIKEVTQQRDRPLLPFNTCHVKAVHARTTEFPIFKTNFIIKQGWRMEIGLSSFK